MTRLTLLTSFCLILSACSGSVKEFVSAVTPPTTTTPSTGTSNGPMALKVSPGRLDGTGTNVAVTANVTATNQLHQAGDISVRLTMSRVRVTTSQ
jgi:hypothetical protein